MLYLIEEDKNYEINGIFYKIKQIIQIVLKKQ